MPARDLTARHRSRARLALLLLILIVLDGAAYVVEHLGLLLLAGGIALVAGVWVRRRPHQPAPRVIQAKAEPSEVGQLRAEVRQLRADLAAARESAHQAWDQAASVPPRPQAAPPSARDRLLSDRLAGVHDLFGRNQ